MKEKIYLCIKKLAPLDSVIKLYQNNQECTLFILIDSEMRREEKTKKIAERLLLLSAGLFYFDKTLKSYYSRSIQQNQFVIAAFAEGTLRFFQVYNYELAYAEWIQF